MIYAYKIPATIISAFKMAGVSMIPVDTVPEDDPQSIIIWYAKTEADVMLYEQINNFGRKIILGAESLELENPSMIALLLRQSNVEMYYPFLAQHLTKVLDPERHWFVYRAKVEESQDTGGEKVLPVLFSGTGKDALAIWGPPGVGKTTVVLSIAAALARTKAKVLVIDTTVKCDLLYRVRLQDPPLPITFQDVYNTLLQNKEPKFYRMADNLDILPRKQAPELNEDALMYVLDFLKRKYDFILFDVSSTPDKIGHLALRMVSRVLLVANFDLLPLTFWHQEVYSSLLLPEHKVSVLLNGVYPSKYADRKTILEFLRLKHLGQIPVEYEKTMDAKLGYTSPYLIAEEDYKTSIDEVIQKLWNIEIKPKEDLMLKAKGLITKFKGG